MRANFLIILLVTFGFTFGQNVKIKLIETTDTHGAIYPFDFINNKGTNSSLANIYSYVKQERIDTSQTVILLSGGDLIQGTPAVYYYNFEAPTEKHLYARVMNYMRYAAAAVGNHDIEAGHAVYDKFNNELNFPWLAANAVKESDGKPYFTPYITKEIKGIKIAILGLVTPYIPHWLPENIYEGIVFEDMIESAEKWMKIIREKEKPDVVVGLFHSGVDYTYGGQTADTYKNENASLLVAEKVPGFDVVFVGHDHHGWNRTITNIAGEEVLIAGGTSSARDFAVVNLSINKSDDEITVDRSSRLLKSKNFPADPEFIDKFSKEFTTIKQYVSRPIGNLSETISSKDAFFGDAAFTDLIHTIQLEISKAQISFTAPLSFNAEISKGNIFVRDMFKLYRYENMLYTMKLTGKEIDAVLEYSYGNWLNQMKTKNDHLLYFVEDENGNILYNKRTSSPELHQRFYNFESAEGIIYKVDVTKPFGQRVEIASLANGDTFNLDSVYTVAMSSYRGNGGGGHLTQGAGIPKEKLKYRLIYSTDKDLRYYLMKWIEKKKNIKPVVTHNWKIVPADFAEIGKKKDEQILFGSEK